MIEIKKHIYYDTQQKQIRVALTYEEFNNLYLGYFLGYCGGGVQCYGYFKMTKDYKKVKIFSENGRFWKENLKRQQKDKLYKLMDETKKNMEFDKENYMWNYTEEYLKKLEKNEYENNSIYEESPKFNGNILSTLSEKWYLLTSYK